MTAAKVSNKTDKPKLTKRQKRKKVNESNTWQQQPKIKSTEARNKGYLRIAGFTKEGKPKSTINPDHDFINSPEYKFGRLLASPDARIRHATILKLKDYLRARTEPKNDKGGLSVLDLMKLWKGLWHTLYLCDGVVVQDEVSKHLSELLWSVGGTEEEDEYAGRVYLEMEDGEDKHECDSDECCIEEDPDPDNSNYSSDNVIEMEESDDESEEGETDITDIHPAADEEVKHCRGAHLSALYVRAYFRTLTREWSNMDKYRIDKFYTLTRLLLREIYRYMRSRHWNLGIIRLFNDAIFEEVLRNKTYGNGVRFHMLDICLEELAKVNGDEHTAGLPLTEATFLDCLEPYFAMAQRVEESHVHSRVLEKVLLRFLNEFSVVSDNYEPNDDSKKNGLIMDQVHVGTVAQFIFELGSDPETEDRYRKQLYDMHKMYMKRIRIVGRDVLLSDDSDENDDELMVDDEDVFVEDRVNDEHVFKDETGGENQAEPKSHQNISKNENQTNIDTNPEKPVKTKSRKNHKGKKDDSQKISQVSLSKEEEDIIVISTKEQKAAEKAIKKALKSCETKATKSKDEVDLESSGSKKTVKFGNTNKSKSYKASIKDLKRIDANQTLLKTPEKSILLKKHVGNTKRNKK